MSDEKVWVLLAHEPYGNPSSVVAVYTSHRQAVEDCNALQLGDDAAEYDVVEVKFYP